MLLGMMLVMSKKLGNGWIECIYLVGSLAVESWSCGVRFFFLMVTLCGLFRISQVLKFQSVPKNSNDIDYMPSQ